MSGLWIFQSSENKMLMGEIDPAKVNCLSNAVRLVSQITKYGWRVGNYCHYISKAGDQLLNSELRLIIEMNVSNIPNEDHIKTMTTWYKTFCCKECDTTHIIHLILVWPFIFSRKFHTFLIMPPWIGLLDFYLWKSDPNKCLLQTSKKLQFYTSY